MPTHDIDDEGNCWQDLLHCSFCGAEPPEAKELVIGPGVSICSVCVRQCAGILRAAVDSLPAPCAHSMEVMAQLMRAVAAGLDGLKRCPWCCSANLIEQRCVASDGVGWGTIHVCCQCGAWEVAAGEDISTLTPKEMEKGWHGTFMQKVDALRTDFNRPADGDGENSGGA